MKTLILPFLFLLTFVFSCRDNSADETLEKNVASYDVYVAGRENNNACYWKNGSKVSLINGNNIYPEKIIVENNNVYVYGSSLSVLANFTFWKNNIKYDVLQYLNIPSNLYFRVSDFYVNNGDIYILGILENPTPTNPNEKYQFCYWKNGIKTILETNENDIYASGWQEMVAFQNDIYILKKSNYQSELGYYKNDQYFLISQKGFSSGITSNSNGVFMIVKDPSNFNDPAYIKNIITNQKYSYKTDFKLIMDGNDFYSLSGYNQYIKNDNVLPINDTDDYNNPWDLKVINQNKFMIRMKISQGTVFGIEYKVFVNNVEIQHIVQEMNGIQYNSNFNSIFVVPN